MRIVAVTARVGDLVTPTQEAIDSDYELQAELRKCRHNQGKVIAVYTDFRPYPIAVELENGEVMNFEQYELEDIE